MKMNKCAIPAMGFASITSALISAPIVLTATQNINSAIAVNTLGYNNPANAETGINNQPLSFSTGGTNYNPFGANESANKITSIADYNTNLGSKFLRYYNPAATIGDYDATQFNLGSLDNTNGEDWLSAAK
ncbi:hypothetical protein FACS1894166_08430 [Bacilli bacterium]|nr:hypothetical protein FACS1894166_08430 [Bacilli bacterium]